MQKTCNDCCSDKKPTSVPYQVYNDFKTFSNNTIKRFIAVIVLLIILLVGSNVAWLVYESQFELVDTTTEEIFVDANNGGNANYIGNDGDIYNGKNKG